MRQGRIRGMERQRDERLEAVGFILQFAQPKQVIHAFFVCFYVAVKHGGVGTHAKFVSRAGDLKPHLAAYFMVANDAAHARVEDFGASTGRESTPASFILTRTSRSEIFARRE